MFKRFATMAFGAFLLLGGVSAAMAEQIPGHPRVNEIDNRLANQRRRVDAGVNHGQINARQEARDNARDARVSRQLSHDEAIHGGHITEGEQRRMNRELTGNSERIYEQRH